MTGFSYLHCNFNHHHHHYNLKKKQKQNENDNDSKSNCIGKNHHKTTTSTNSKAENYNSNAVSNNNFNHYHHHYNWKNKQVHTKNDNASKSNCTGNSCDKTKTQKCGENNFLKLTGKSTDNNSRGKVSDDNIFKNGKIGALSNESTSLKTKVKPEAVTENDSGNAGDKTITSNAQGKVSYNNNFENGEIGAATNESTSLKAKVKPKVITENGNSFLRVTGSVGDSTNTPAGGIRSEVDFTSKPGQMPELTDANKKQDYSFDVRFNDNFSGNFMQFFQASTKESAPASYYDFKDNVGPPFRFFRKKDGTVTLYQRNQGNGNNDTRAINLGKFADGEFANIEFKVNWSAKKNEGEAVVLVNGIEKARIKDATTIGPLADMLPAVRGGTYNGTNPGAGAGQVDFDNIRFTQLDPDAKL